MSLSATLPSVPYKQTNFFLTGVDKVVSGISEFKTNTNSMYIVLQLAEYSLMGLQACIKGVAPLANTMLHVTGSISVIEFFGDLIDSAQYWICKSFIDDLKNAKICNFLGCFTITFVTIGSSIAWLAKLGFISLEKMAVTIGNIPVLGSVASIGLAPFLAGFAGLAYIFWVGDSIQTIVVAKNVHQRVKASIDLATRIIKVALCFFATASLVCPMSSAVTIPVFVSLGVVASLLGMTSVLYTHYNKAAFE